MSYAVNLDDVLDQLRAGGLDVVLPLVIGGDKPVRCKEINGGGEKRGWYMLFEWVADDGDTYITGSYGIYRGDDPGKRTVELSKKCADCGRQVNIKEKQCSGCGSKTLKKREQTPEEKAAIKARHAADAKRRAVERGAEIQRAAQWATAVWRNCREIAPDEHDYIGRKRLSTTGGARIFESNDGIFLDGAEPDDYKYLATFHGALVIPMCDDAGRVFGLQFILSRERHKERIARTGRDKEYWPAGLSKEAHYWMIGGSPTRLCLVVEGYATGMSLHEATGFPVAVAFDAGNLIHVGQSLRKRYKRRVNLLFCADDDWLQKCRECGAYTPVQDAECKHCGKPHGKINAGKLRANEAATAVSGAAVLPTFAAARPEDRKGPTDFNDLHVAEGLQAVRAQVEASLTAQGWVVAEPPAREDSAAGGEGADDAKAKRVAVSLMSVEDAVERFLPIDDGTGDHLFCSWTNKIVKTKQMLVLLPAGARNDDVKRDPKWIRRGAYFIHEVGFDPSGRDPNVKLNTWRGWPMRPRKGCCDRIRDHLVYLCNNEGNGEAIAHWIECWLAYPLQHPGAKMGSAIIMHGPQGTGKSVLFNHVMARIYGDYATILNQRGLEDKFNSDWSDSKLFIVAEEVVTRAEMWHIKNELKELVTGDWIRINPKNIAAYRQKNQINIVYLSNEGQPLPLENDDRRHLVVWTPPACEEKYYDDLLIEIENGGIEAFYHHLLTIDLGDFHPKKRPPMTVAKQELIHLSLPSEQRFIVEWTAGDTDWPVCPCGSMDLYSAYLKWCRTNGVTRPRESNHFIGYISKAPGWFAGHRDRYDDCHCTPPTKRQRMVIPPAKVLEDIAQRNADPGADRRRKDGQSLAAWHTEGFFSFRAALGVEE